MLILCRTILFAVILCLLGSCKIGTFFKDIGNVARDGKQIAADIKAVRGAVVPIDSFTMAAASGVLTEMAAAQTEEKLDSISARISRSLTTYLNQSLQNIDASPAGNRLIMGAVDTLVAAETQLRLRMLIENISQQAGKDVAALIRRSMSELTSPANKARLNSMLLSLFNDRSADSLSFMLNSSIAQIDFELVGSQISEDIFRSNLRPEIDSLARTAVRSIFDEIRKEENAGSFFDDFRNIVILGIGLFGVLMALLFWWNRHKSVQMNKVFLAAMENLEHPISHEMRQSVEREARHKGVLRNVNALMKREHKLKSDDKKDKPA